MKKILLFVTMLCCMAAATAQSFETPSSSDLMRNRAFRDALNNRETIAITHRLDSIVAIDGFIKIASVYDNNYLCTRDSAFSSTGFMYTLEYTYDNQRRLIAAVSQGSSNDDKYEMSYNAQGLLSETKYYTNDNGNWILEGKTTTGYDSNGNPTVVIDYDRTGSGEWEYDEKTEYTFNGDQLVVAIESDWNGISNKWVEKEKTNYTYDASGNCIAYNIYEKASDNSWRWTSRHENTFDNKHNLIQIRIYEFNSTEPTGEALSEEWNVTYDAHVTRKNLAISPYSGFLLLESEVYTTNNIPMYIEHELFGSFAAVYNSRYFYLNMTNVDEQSDNGLQLWPNPAQETLSLGAENLRQVAVYTLEGKEVMLVKDGFDAIEVSQLASGCYLLKATLNDGSVATQKFIKQ